MGGGRGGGKGGRNRGAGPERCNGGALVAVSGSCCSAVAFDADASATAATAQQCNAGNMPTHYWFISKKLYKRDGMGLKSGKEYIHGEGASWSTTLQHLQYGNILFVHCYASR